MMSPELAKAYIKFQSTCPAIEKDAEVEVKTKSGATYKFKYASFGNIVRTIKESLSAAEIGYTFLTLNNKFICRIMHSTGNFQDTELDIPKMGDQMQENGSKLTYMKRYALVLALGLDTDMDDDGNTSEGNEIKFKTPPREHIANTENYIEKKGAEIKNYVVKIGKFKDRKLSSIDQMEIQNYLIWLSNQASEKNKPLTGDWLEFAKIAEVYITNGNPQS